MNDWRAHPERAARLDAGTRLLAGDGLAGLADLAHCVKFEPHKGRIQLGDQRMLLLHARTLRTLREGLIDTLGHDGARALLTRIGFEAGAQDAELARQIRGDAADPEAFWVGPQLHGIEGMVRVELVRMQIDVTRGHHYGEFLWHDSVEDEDYVERHGQADFPICWTQIGYASGYTSRFMGRTIVYREVSCRSMGEAYCRIVGKSADEWGDADEDLYYFGLKGKAKALAPSLSLPAPARRRAATTQADSMLIGREPAFIEALRQLRLVAPTNAPVLLIGETGVGKECFARELHRASERADGPFVAVNCAALPDTLLEAEMFGVEKGAYTGASSARMGRFERADGGTLFLDEITSLSPSGQAKLLRVLQDLEVERLGGVRARAVDVRIVAAAQPELLQQVRDGRFRRDLFYRLAVVSIELPPLRERPRDLPLLARHCLAKAAARYGRDDAGFAPDALQSLARHRFPGNVRELENLIQRALLITPVGQPVSEAALQVISPDAESSAAALVTGNAASLPLLEAQLLEQAVDACHGNLSAAARRLGITRAQVAYRLEKYGLGRRRRTPQTRR